MVIGWALSTCEDTRIVVTANTDTQLRTKTWPEVAKWFRNSVNADWFDVTATAITVKDKGHERLWRADSIPWSVNNTEAFAGLHNEGKRLVVIYDEASGIDDRIWEVTEGALTDENTEIIWIAFGNPTQNTGRFRECFGRYKHRWKTQQVDSRTVEGTNKDQLDKWVADYGEDSDFVRVRVRGEFPRAGSTQFISGQDVGEARQRTVAAEGWKTIAVDVARFGDDATVIGLRQGLHFQILDTLRSMDTVVVSRVVMARMREHAPRLTVVDGDGLGAGVVDNIRHQMWEWMQQHPLCAFREFHGGVPSDNALMYLNQRAQCWGAAKEWLKGGDIPDDPELDSDLTGPEYYYNAKGQIQLESKDDMRKRGLASPDKGDTLAMTFAEMPKPLTEGERERERLQTITDPTQHMIAVAKLQHAQKAKTRFRGR